MEYYAVMFPVQRILLPPTPPPLCQISNTCFSRNRQSTTSRIELEEIWRGGFTSRIYPLRLGPSHPLCSGKASSHIAQISSSTDYDMLM